MNDKGKIKKNTAIGTNQDAELMRFGHTVTLSKYFIKIFYFTVNKQQAILFGGAKGSSSKYDICDDSYLFKIEDQIWLKLNRILKI
jgi:hypothetical protein